MTEFTRGLLVGLFLGVPLGGLVVAVLLLRWWTGALEEARVVGSGGCWTPLLQAEIDRRAAQLRRLIEQKGKVGA